MSDTYPLDPPPPSSIVQPTTTTTVAEPPPEDLPVTGFDLLVPLLVIAMACIVAGLILTMERPER